MANETEPVWELFVDESGRFAPDAGAVQVCGILVDGAPTLASTRNLRPALRLTFPGVGYPPHASDLTTVPGYVGCWVRAGEPSDEAAPAPVFGRCRDTLRQAPPAPAFDAWRNFAAGGVRRLDPGAAWQAEAWLARASPDDWARASEFVARRAHVFRKMMAAFGSARSGRLLVIGNHELEPHPDPSLPDLLRPHRYLLLLVGLFERTIAVVGREGLPCTVRVRVGDRWLVESMPLNGPWEGRPLELTRVHLDTAAEAARRSMRSVGASVRFECLPPEKFDRTVHPGVAVADQVSHALVDVLAAAVSFAQVDLQARAQLGAPCATHTEWLPEAGPLPTIAANGPPRDAVRAALSGEPVPSLDRIRPGWAGDQARAWTRAIVGGGGR